MADSDTILISCPECQASYELTSADCGETVECACGCQFVVPVADVPEAAQPAAPAQAMVLCPSCQAVYQLDRDVLGDNVECQCGTIFEATEVALPEAAPEPVAAATIRTLCPTCSAEYELEAEAVGQEVECAWGVQFVVTVAPAAEPDSARSPDVASQSSRHAPPCRPPSESDQLSGNGTRSVPATLGSDETSAPPATSSPPPPKPSAGKKNQPAKKTSPGKKSTTSLLIMGGGAMAAVAVLLVVLFSGGGSSSKSGKDSGTSVARQEKTKPTDSQQTVAALAPKPSEAAPVAPDEKRTSLAERLEQARRSQGSGGANGEQPGDAAATGSQTAAVAAEEMAAVAGSGASSAELSANPNAQTNQQDFVIGGPSKGGQPAASPPTAPTTSNVATAPAESTAPSAESNDDPPAATSTAAAPPPRKRIEFVPPKRRYNRFKDAAAAGFKQFASMREKKAAAESGEQADRDAWEAELADTGGLLKSALQLVDAEYDPQRVLQARLVTAFCYLEAGQVYEAGILAHALARWTPADLIIEPETKDEPKPENGEPAPRTGQALSAGEAILAAENAAAAAAKKDAATASVDPAVPMQPALEAAMLALAAFVQAHDAAPEDNRDAEFKVILEVAELFEAKFPDHEKVDSIRLYVGQLHQIRDDSVGAAEWYARVSKASTEFARSRLQAGQTLWSSYLAASQQAAENSAMGPDETTEPAGTQAATLNPAQLKQRAQQYLTT